MGNSKAIVKVITIPAKLSLIYSATRILRLCVRANFLNMKMRILNDQIHTISVLDGGKKHARLLVV